MTKRAVISVVLCAPADVCSMMRLSEADASICVMSLVEVATASGEVRVPERVKHLLKPNTHVLLNKLDLCDEGLRIDVVRKAFSHCAGVWPMSLSTQAGANEFVKGLEGDLVKRYVDLNVTLLSLGDADAQACLLGLV